MTPYLDAGFLLTLLVKSRGNAVAHQLLRRVETPVTLNFLHQLQAENLLACLVTSDGMGRQTVGGEGHRLWQKTPSEPDFST